MFLFTLEKDTDRGGVKSRQAALISLPPERFPAKAGRSSLYYNINQLEELAVLRDGMRFFGQTYEAAHV